MPLSYAYKLWDHKELIPNWMSIISRVKVQIC